MRVDQASPRPPGTSASRPSRVRGKLRPSIERIRSLPVSIYPAFDAVVVTDPLGRITTTFHDSYGRTIETAEQAELAYLSTRASWSLLGKMVGVTDPMGNQWEYIYDSLGRRIAADDPDLGFWTYQYDAAGRLTLRTDALGQETAFTYDDLGRVLTQTTRVGEPDEETTTNTYDEVRSGYFNRCRDGADRPECPLVRPDNRPVHQCRLVGPSIRDGCSRGCADWGTGPPSGNESVCICGQRSHQQGRSQWTRAGRGDRR